MHGSSAHGARLLPRRTPPTARFLLQEILEAPDSRSVDDDQRLLAIRDQLERGFSRLSADERAVLVLHYYIDLPLAEAAAVMDVPLGTMKSRLSRATQALRAGWTPENGMPHCRPEVSHERARRLRHAASILVRRVGTIGPAGRSARGGSGNSRLHPAAPCLAGSKRRRADARAKPLRLNRIVPLALAAGVSW